METSKPKVNLKSLRVIRSLNQDELAEKLGKSVYTINNWEAGKTSPKITDYYKLKEILDKDDEFFLQF